MGKAQFDMFAEQEAELFPAAPAVVHPDLFGAPAPRAYVPDPAHVRNRLEALLSAMRDSPVWPWDGAMMRLHREKTFAYLLGLLPDDEAAGWRNRIEAEVARLDANAVAAE